MTARRAVLKQLRHPTRIWQNEFECYPTMVRRLNTMHEVIKGYNSRLDFIQAACRRIKLKHFDQWYEHRRTIAGVCSEALAESQN